MTPDDKVIVTSEGRTIYPSIPIGYPFSTASREMTPEEFHVWRLGYFAAKRDLAEGVD